MVSGYRKADKVFAHSDNFHGLIAECAIVDAHCGGHFVSIFVLALRLRALPIGAQNNTA